MVTIYVAVNKTIIMAALSTNCSLYIHIKYKQLYSIYYMCACSMYVWCIYIYIYIYIYILCMYVCMYACIVCILCLKKHRNKRWHLCTLTHHISIGSKVLNPLECIQDHSARDLELLVLKEMGRVKVLRCQHLFLYFFGHS